jgi:hypothetical protein
MNRLACAGLALLISLSAAVSGQAQVGADLNISPKRVAFEGAVRSTTVYIYNRGSEPAAYKIDLVDRVMTPDGQIRAMDDITKDPKAAGETARFKSALPMIQYTPRRVTLAPGQSQTVRLRLLRPADLVDGEYRTTLTVSSLPPEDVGLTAEQAVKPGGGELSIKVIPLFGISIPVIVRQGAQTTAARLENVVLKASQLHLDIGRTGSGSLFGDIEVHRNDAKGAIVGLVKGVGIYPEVDRRSIELTLNGPVAAGEKLFLLYRDDDTRPGTMLASESLIVR